MFGKTFRSGLLAALAFLCLIFMVVFLPAISYASILTYNFGGFPSQQVDHVSGGIDGASATFVSDATDTTISTAAYTITSSAGTPYTANPATLNTNGPYLLTTSYFELLPGSVLTLSENTPNQLSVLQFPTPSVLGPYQYEGYVVQLNSQGIGTTLVDFDVDNSPFPIDPATNDYIVATAEPVPEPSNFSTFLTLLGSALLGRGIVYLRRREGVTMANS